MNTQGTKWEVSLQVFLQPAHTDFWLDKILVLPFSFLGKTPALKEAISVI